MVFSTLNVELHVSLKLHNSKVKEKIMIPIICIILIGICTIVFFRCMSKQDPLKKKLKQAKRIRASKKKQSWRDEMKRQKEEKRILTFVINEICPECGERVTLKQRTDTAGLTDNHYKCTNCPFEKHDYCDCDDEDFI